MFHNRGKAVFWMDSCVIIMTLRKFPKLYGWAKGNNCWIFLWLSVKLLMLPLLFVIIMPSHNFMVSLKQKRGELQIGRVFYCFRYVCTYLCKFVLWGLCRFLHPNYLLQLVFCYTLVQSICRCLFPISGFSYFVIRFRSHIFFVPNFSYLIIRFYYRAIK